MTFDLALPFLVVGFFSVLAFWKHEALIFLLTSGASMMVGLQWYDDYVTNYGLGISLLFIAYSVICFGFAFACLFKPKQIGDGNGD